MKEIKEIYDKAINLWYKIVEPSYEGEPRGHPGVGGPSSNPKERWNEEIGYLKGAIAALKYCLIIKETKNDWR